MRSEQPAATHSPDARSQACQHSQCTRTEQLTTVHETTRQGERRRKAHSPAASSGATGRTPLMRRALPLRQTLGWVSRAGLLVLIPARPLGGGRATRTVHLCSADDAGNRRSHSLIGRARQPEAANTRLFCNHETRGVSADKFASRPAPALRRRPAEATVPSSRSLGRQGSSLRAVGPPEVQQERVRMGADLSAGVFLNDRGDSPFPTPRLLEKHIDHARHHPAHHRTARHQPALPARHRGDSARDRACPGRPGSDGTGGWWTPPLLLKPGPEAARRDHRRRDDRMPSAMPRPAGRPAAVSASPCRRRGNLDLVAASATLRQRSVLLNPSELRRPSQPTDRLPPAETLALDLPAA